jgi:hypothetical protein
VIGAQAPLGVQLLDVAVGKREAQVPAHRKQDHRITSGSNWRHLKRLRARSTKFEELLSEALRQGWLDESKTSPSWLQEALTVVAK